MTAFHVGARASSIGRLAAERSTPRSKVYRTCQDHANVAALVGAAATATQHRPASNSLTRRGLTHQRGQAQNRPRHLQGRRRNPHRFAPTRLMIRRLVLLQRPFGAYLLLRAVKVPAAFSSLVRRLTLTSAPSTLSTQTNPHTKSPQKIIWAHGNISVANVSSLTPPGLAIFLLRTRGRFRDQEMHGKTFPGTGYMRDQKQDPSMGRTVCRWSASASSAVHSKP